MAGENNQKESGQKQFVILDTCSIQHAVGPNVSVFFRPYLEKLRESGLSFAISEISVLECLRSAGVKGADEIIEWLSQYTTNYSIVSEVLILAVKLADFYAEEEATKGHADSISIPDTIIAATAVLTGSYIVTSDVNDFPRPFFDEVDWKTIRYEQQHRQKHICVALLRPNIEVINLHLKRLQDQYEKVKEKKKVKLSRVTAQVERAVEEIGVS